LKVNGDNSDVTKSLMDKVRGVRDDLSDRILQQHKDTAHDHLNRGTQFLTEEYFPEGRRDQFIYRSKKVLWFIFYAPSLLILFSQVMSEARRLSRVHKTAFVLC
jgi:hypothetical protein